MCNIGTLCLETIDDTPLGILLEVFILFYAYLCLGRVCDEYLVPSVETLCARWKIREDVAGGTFLAMSSAAPEITLNVISTIKGQSADQEASNMGVSLIVGTGIVAFTAVPGLCAMAAKGTLHLKRRPLLRDFGFYGISLAALCIFFADGLIHVYEAGIMVGLYVTYILLLTTSPAIRRWFMERKAGKPLESKKNFVLLKMEEDQRAEEERKKLLADAEGGNIQGEDPQEAGDKRSTAVKVLDFLAWPLDQAYKYTCPACKIGEKYEHLYPITFFVSVLYVAVYAFVISAVCDRIVFITGASMAFFGVVFLALATEMTDMIASLSVARRGYGSMAISNSSGAQITNVNVGLGLPWLIATIFGAPIELSEHAHIQVAAFFLTGGWCITLSLLLGHAVFTRLDKCTLTKMKGAFLIGTYIVIIGGYAAYIFTHPQPVDNE